MFDNAVIQEVAKWWHLTRILNTQPACSLLTASANFAIRARTAARITCIALARISIVEFSMCITEHALPIPQNCRELTSSTPVSINTLLAIIRALRALLSVEPLTFCTFIAETRILQFRELPVPRHAVQTVVLITTGRAVLATVFAPL